MLIDTGVEDDFISQMFVKKLGLPLSGPAPGAAKSIDGRPLFIYGSVDVPFVLRDSGG